ncbi:MAG: alcohol dehydrogenase catalytic domain-containing protein [Propionibacteriaceae bacterium]|nr:alcohol dehydrogenase catalytic domain-containing protein [Propionibacteriaceae bacterium]
MTTQYAVQITGPDRIEINRAMPVPTIGPRQLLLRIDACGICFSDTKLMHAFASHPRKTPIRSGLTPDEVAQIPTYRPGAQPVVPGHEPVARIAAVGDEVTRFQVGQRVLVQTDYRHIPTVASNAAFGYDFDGALEEMALVDERMVIDPATDQSYLIPVGEEASSSAIALIEPWACVETAYAWTERTGLRRGGSLLVVVDPGCEPEGLDDLVAEAAVARRVDCPGGASIPSDGAFDDIIYCGADAATVEALGARLGKGGLMTIVACGRTFDREVHIDAGRIHYDLIRYAGTTGNRVRDGVAWIPTTCEVRPFDRIAVIGAAGPMGLMHAVRAVTIGVDGVTLDAVDVDQDRLDRLSEVLTPIASRTGVAARIANSAQDPLRSGYTYLALMVPSPALLCQAIGLAGPGAIVNAFAGFAVGTMAAVDMQALLENRVYLVGTSGSRIEDMVTVLGRVQAGIVDTNISLDAITGMAGVPAAIDSVDKRTSHGKIMVYPWAHDLGLIRLDEMAEKLPEVAAAMVDGGWTRQAELVLERVAGTPVPQQ